MSARIYRIIIEVEDETLDDLRLSPELLEGDTETRAEVLGRELVALLEWEHGGSAVLLGVEDVAAVAS